MAGRQARPFFFNLDFILYLSSFIICPSSFFYMANPLNIIIIGGGAAGFFAALTAKEANPQASVQLLEKTGSLLSKVRISGGGRCNVTHACFDPRLLVQNYPRGSKELIGPFTRFQPRHTIEWFESRGVKLKVEQDGRMFPVGDDSSVIIDCLLEEARRLKVGVHIKQRIEQIQRRDQKFQLILSSGDSLECNRLLLASGSSPQGHGLAKALGHTIQDPVPSLFTFNVPDSPLKDLAGISMESATLHLESTRLEQTGPLLITHWGFSGPAALKLSAWGARILHEKNYRMTLIIDWLPGVSKEIVIGELREMRSNFPGQHLQNKNLFGIPRNLWKRLVDLSGIDENKRLSETGNDSLQSLCTRLKSDKYQVDGKTTYKEEFVTCGGVTLSEVDFKTMESRICKDLYFAGEILDIDAVTGGFNFQNAWTSGWLAGHAMAINDSFS